MQTYFKRQQAVERAHELVKPDREKYDKAWERYAGETTALRELETAWNAIRSMIPAVAREKKPVQPVEKLSELYDQAEAVNPWYQDKVGKWAAAIETTVPWEPIGVKTSLRSIEKIRRTYFGNVS